MAINCDNEPYEGEIITENNSCNLAIQATNSAAENLINSNTENYALLCELYRSALENQIEVCGDDSGDLQDVIELIEDCSVESEDPCEIAQSATALAFEAFLNTTTQDYEVTCSAYVTALENEIIACGDDGSLESLINELGDCLPVVFDVTGSWMVVSITNDIARDLDNDGDVSNDYLDEFDCYNNETVDFNTDGTGTFFFRSYTEIQVESAPGTFDNVDFIVTCIEEITNVDFTWEQIGLNIIDVTLNTDGTVLNFFRNGDNIFIARRDDFVATSISPNVDSIVEDLIYEYVKL
ncbi:hypothetical protein [Winogradskyella sp.]|uniref:hypothetical protein n=1 Tax=Winogradskyella sp. TaxID=1883156 RepID=UPI003F6ACEB4